MYSTSRPLAGAANGIPAVSWHRGTDTTEGGSLRLLTHLLEPKVAAYAHCDLPGGVYDPAQARIEAESVKAIAEMFWETKQG